MDMAAVKLDLKFSQIPYRASLLPCFSKFFLFELKHKMKMDCAELSYIFNEEADWFPIQDWPKWLQDLFCRHKSKGEVWRFFAFLFLNGMEPEKAAYWTTADSLLGHGGYDRTRQADLKNMVDCLEGKKGPAKREEYINRFNRVSYYNLSDKTTFHA